LEARPCATGFVCMVCARLGDARARMLLECPRTWGSLASTTDPNVRHCGSCGHLVHRAESDAELREHARRGHCVATSRRLLNLGGGRVGLHYAVRAGDVNGGCRLSMAA